MNGERNVFSDDICTFIDESAPSQLRSAAAEIKNRAGARGENGVCGRCLSESFRYLVDLLFHFRKAFLRKIREYSSRDDLFSL